MSDLDYHKQAFNSVGWFIPPFVQLGYLGRVAQQIYEGKICERTLENHLA